MIVFVQVFGLNSPGGGARILRSLLQDAPTSFLSICTTPKSPPPTHLGQEIHLPIRPYLGRVERTRFGGSLGYLNPLFVDRFKQRLEAVLREAKPSAIHAIPQGVDFWYTFQIAEKLGIPYYLNVHDELTYNLQGKPELAEAIEGLAIVWAKAQGRIVISEAMGKEYCRRYGNLPYIVVTDGLATIPTAPRIKSHQKLNVYFMGSLHISYKANFYALLQALNQFSQVYPDWEVALTIRGELPFPLKADRITLKVLPWASQTEIDQDMNEADLLYIPLPFEEAYQSFSRYSLSTKLVTYLGSGLPILYHGPHNAAAGELLSQHQAAIIADSLDPNAIQQSIDNAKVMFQQITENALTLGRQQFLLTEMRSRFWHFVADQTLQPIR